MYLCVHQDEEENATGDFLRKVATVLLTSGNKRLFAALSKAIADGIPCLSRACLITVAWMSSSLISIENADLQSLASSTLMARLLESLSYDRALEERVLATLSLLNFVRNSGMGKYFLLWYTTENLIVNHMHKRSRTINHKRKDTEIRRLSNVWRCHSKLVAYTSILSMFILKINFVSNSF